MIEDPSNESVRGYIVNLGYDLNPMKGIEGQFYTDNRLSDLHELCREIINERTWRK